MSLSERSFLLSMRLKKALLRLRNGSCFIGIGARDAFLWYSLLTPRLTSPLLGDMQIRLLDYGYRDSKIQVRLKD